MQTEDDFETWLLSAGLTREQLSKDVGQMLGLDATDDPGKANVYVASPWPPSVALSRRSRCESCGIEVGISPHGRSLLAAHPMQVLCLACARAKHEESKKHG